MRRKTLEEGDTEQEGGNAAADKIHAPPSRPRGRFLVLELLDEEALDAAIEEAAAATEGSSGVNPLSSRYGYEIHLAN